ncbi:IS4 family transposase, partial [Bacteroidales bacterium OttesenSCG-928-C03]|nr:IS4 family transposase [Bacteroidales bacterium OttesenSCG-928-C03]
DGLRQRSNDLFKDFYFALIEHFSSILSVSRIKGVSFEKFYAFDSTTISLFSDIMKGVGRNPKGDGKKKGGLKVHMMIDAHAETAKYATISEAKQHDKNFLKSLSLPIGSMIVFDKAYNHYFQFSKWTNQGVNFVCRLKENAAYEVQEVLFERTLNGKEHGVTKEEHIHLKYKEGKKTKRTLCLRKVDYVDEKGRKYQFIANNWEITAEEVAFIYKKRWSIELVFKKMKQNFQLHYFYSETENGIKTQVWCTLIAHLLLMVLKAKTKTAKAFSTVAALVRIHLISYLDVMWMITNARRNYKKQVKSRNKSPSAVQLSCF